MSVDETPDRTTRARVGWAMLVGVAALLVLNGAALYAIIVETQVEQTIGVLLAAFGGVALVVAVEGYRRGTRWAWHATWVVVASLAAVGLHTLRGDRLDVPLTYVFLATVALVGQLLADRDGPTPGAGTGERS